MQSKTHLMLPTIARSSAFNGIAPVESPLRLYIPSIFICFTLLYCLNVTSTYKSIFLGIKVFRVLDPVSSTYGMKDRSTCDLDKGITDQGSTPTGFAPRGTPFGTKLDWIKPSMQLCRSNMLQPHVTDRVYDAFHMLQHEPSVQRMVISLSFDGAVWDAVLNNEVVWEFKESFNQGCYETQNIQCIISTF